MDRIFMENYRCFRKPQSARLAPLTLLVGENSTGKTSFLALVRALWEVAFQDEAPDFQEAPYDLGTFRDVAHNRGRRGGQAAYFQAGFRYGKSRYPRRHDVDGLEFRVTFEERGAFPFPVKRGFNRQGVWVEVKTEGNNDNGVRIGTPTFERDFSVTARTQDDTQLFPLRRHLQEIMRRNAEGYPGGMSGEEKEGKFDSLAAADLEALNRLIWDLTHLEHSRGWPFASAPVRSRPRRTYDPARPSQDPEGAYIPTYLASLSHRDQAGWKSLKDGLEQFGRESGLFDEISIKSLGKAEGSPFQVQVRKYGGRLKGPERNLIDVGYGVSQALPILIELLDPDSPYIFLLQQPEVHLHPKAQAALGSLFCSVAGPERQLIVETHSDYLLDRVRMDVRDKKTGLKPEDVSILYFERDGLEVNIHSLRLDEMGNVLDAPPGYGQFFMDEVTRSIGL